MSGNLAFRESAFWVALYGFVVVLLGRRLVAGLSGARTSLWLTAYAVAGLWSFFLLGFFQENIFSLQTNVFALGIPCYLVGLYSLNDATWSWRKGKN